MGTKREYKQGRTQIQSNYIDGNSTRDKDTYKEDSWHRSTQKQTRREEEGKKEKKTVKEGKTHEEERHTHTHRHSENTSKREHRRKSNYIDGNKTRENTQLGTETDIDTKRKGAREGKEENNKRKRDTRREYKQGRTQTQSNDTGVDPSRDKGQAYSPSSSAATYLDNIARMAMAQELTSRAATGAVGKRERGGLGRAVDDGEQGRGFTGGGGRLRSGKKVKEHLIEDTCARN